MDNESKQFVNDEDAGRSPSHIELSDEMPEESDDESEKPASSALRRNAIIAVSTVAALALIVYFFYFNKAKPVEDAAKTDEPKVVVSVKTAKARRGSLAQEFSAVGTISAVRQSTVSAGLSGQIVQMRLLKNQFVKQGEVVAVLNSADLEAQRAEAVAALREAELNRQTVVKVSAPQQSAQAEKDLADARAAVDNAQVLLARRQDLYQKGGIALKEVEATRLALVNAENNLRLIQKSAQIRIGAANPNDVSIAESRIAGANSRLKTIDAQLRQTVVRAPLSGVVVDQFQFQGEYATPGARLVQIADTGTIVVKANFADTIVAELNLGDAVKVLPDDLPGEEMHGKITNIARSADQQNRTIEVWANLNNAAGRLRINGAAEVIISSKETNDAVIVPAAAVSFENASADEGTIMIVGADGLAHEKTVKTGIRRAAEIQIVEGLNGSEEVIVEGNYQLADKTKVEATEAKSSDKGEGEKPDAGDDDK